MPFSVMFGSWVLNEIWIIDVPSALVGMLMSSSKSFLLSNKAHLNPGVRLLLELYCVIVIKHVAFLIIKITISSIVIGLKTLLFSTNSLAKLLSDSLLLDTLLLDTFLSDSSIGQSYSKL